LAGFVGFINDGDLVLSNGRNGSYRVRILDCMSIDQIITRTQFTFSEPGHVTMCEGAGPDSFEILMPGNEIPCKSTPEFIRILNRLFVHFLIFLQPGNMRRRMTIKGFRMIKLFRISGFNNYLSKTSGLLHKRD
jgi:hypothetical protein